MKIGVLSGKGGTGKTFLAVNLAVVASSVVYLDCDIEAPNGYLFLKSELTESEDVFVKIPQFTDHCIACKKCVEFCQFNALALTKSSPILFQEICHSCGGCQLVCPVQAVNEVSRSVGQVIKGKWNTIDIYTGMINIGEASGIPVIKKLFEYANNLEENIIVDCPPGSGCSVMECVSELDYCVFVAEPTIYGLYNLKMVLELAKRLKKPYGVILNKVENYSSPVEKFCKEKDITVLGKIYFDKEISRLNANGEIASLYLKNIKEEFGKIYQKINKERSFI